MPDLQSAYSALELNYTLSSLQYSTPPLRPDGRGTKSHRPVTAETGDVVLPYAYGSARVGFAGGEAIAGLRAEVVRLASGSMGAVTDVDDDGGRGEHAATTSTAATATQGRDSKSETDRGKKYGRLVSVVVDGEEKREWAGPVEAAIGRGRLASDTWAWKILVDIVILTQAEAHPASLISYALHLALLDARLPKCLSGPQEDPLFADDWALAEPLFKENSGTGPPLTVVVAAIPSILGHEVASGTGLQGGGGGGAGITLFDPSTIELGVASTVLAVTFCTTSGSHTGKEAMETDEKESLTILDIRTLDPPGRKVAAVQSTAGGADDAEKSGSAGAWNGVTGGVSRLLMKSVIREVVAEGKEMIASLRDLVSDT